MQTGCANNPTFAEGVASEKSSALYQIGIIAAAILLVASAAIL